MYYFEKSEEYMDLSRIYLAVLTVQILTYDVQVLILCLSYFIITVHITSSHVQCALPKLHPTVFSSLSCLLKQKSNKNTKFKKYEKMKTFFHLSTNSNKALQSQLAAEL